jgi:hypothetical protein
MSMSLMPGYIQGWHVLQEIISEEIVDETDRYEDNQSKRRAKRITTAAVMRGFVLDCCSFTPVTDSFRRIVERERSLPRVSSVERTPLISCTPRSEHNYVPHYGSLLSQSPKTWCRSYTVFSKSRWKIVIVVSVIAVFIICFTHAYSLGPCLF